MTALEWIALGTCLCMVLLVVALIRAPNMYETRCRQCGREYFGQDEDFCSESCKENYSI
jgi:hypothetical protein